jgi:myosin-6
MSAVASPSPVPAPRKGSIGGKLGSSVRNLLKSRSNSTTSASGVSSPTSQTLTTESAPIDAGVHIWIPDAKHEFLPVRTTTTFRRGQPTAVVVPETGATLELTGEQTKSVTVIHDDISAAVPDMITLNDLNEAMLLHNLRMRFKDRHIYTAVDSIIVSINPYERLETLYDAANVALYRTEADRRLAGEEVDASLPPHVYGVANRSFVDLVLHGRDQSCIISGESGAGKTEATKVGVAMLCV